MKYYGNFNSDKDLITKEKGTEIANTQAESKIASALTGSGAIKTELDKKQDALPTVVNDKYLHTNSTTGNLEWTDAGGTLPNNIVLATNPQEVSPVPGSTFDGHTISEFILTSNVVDNLTSTSSTNVLSAAQGKVLNDNKTDKVVSATENSVAIFDAAGGIKSSEKTLGKSVPIDAQFTDTVYDDTILAGRVSTIESKESGWDAKSDFSGSYTDLSNKPTIPTESIISDWGFTKNAGTITEITMNGTSKGTSGNVDLGTVITAHQDISGKANVNNPTFTGTVTAANKIAFTDTTNPQIDFSNNGVAFYMQGNAGQMGLGPTWNSATKWDSSGNMTVGGYINGGLYYTTTAPTAANTQGLKIVVLSSEPATKYEGWIYLITG